MTRGAAVIPAARAASMRCYLLRSWSSLLLLWLRPWLRPVPPLLLPLPIWLRELLLPRLPDDDERLLPCCCCRDCEEEPERFLFDD